MKNVKKNYLYYSLSQIILFTFPLITFPYVSKTLGVNNYGLFHYVSAILDYFLIFAKLGIMNYGTREIAENSNSKKKLTETFFEIYRVQFILTTFVLILYILFCIIFAQDSLVFYLLYSLILVANYFDLAWFFQGVQNFKCISIRNLIINFSLFASVFLLLNDKSDLLIYVLIFSLSQFIGNFIVFFNLFKYIDLKNHNNKISKETMFNHFKGLIILFIPILATNIYSLMDEIMLGKMSLINQVGLYACAKKIMYIPLAFVTPLARTMLPYISKKKSTNRNVSKKTKDRAFLFTIWLGIACSVGIYYIAPYIIELFFSEEYLNAIILIRIMSVYTLFSEISFLLRDVYFLPNRKDKEFVKSVLYGIPINLILNLILIPKYNAIGAVYSTLITELIILIIRLIVIRKDIIWDKLIIKSLKYFISAIIMYFSITLIDFNFNNLLVKLIFDIIVCIIIYVILTWEDFLFFVKDKKVV